jgi:dTDP-4-dehydrorhamnose 3,5-epimerase
MMPRLTAHRTPLAGLVRVDREILGDTRGSFARLFCRDDLRDAGWTWPITQINHSSSAQRGTVRGMHYQHPPHAEAKLVTCIRGQVLDVAVDLRQGSPTFLRWYAEELSAGRGNALLLPPGFAHGFQALSDNVELIYCHSEPYAAHAEAGINPFDPSLGITWPEPPTVVSDRDRNHPFLTSQFAGVVL